MTVQNLRHSYLLLAFLIQKAKSFWSHSEHWLIYWRKIKKAEKDALPAAHFPLLPPTKREL